uniref:Uncharacterized protein n=1 Tax=Salix viminalis TaxID=40686 RepID=A0A6N2MLP5_SALVM
MATTACTSTTSSLMLTYAASTVHPQDLTPSLLSFKSKTLSIYPLVSEIKSSKGVNFYAQTEGKSRPCRVVVAAALSSEVGEGVEETEGEEGGAVVTATVIPPKPKKGKAALTLKRDRRD